MPGFWEWVALAVLALLIFGPERLPKLARDAGRFIAKFKAEASATLQELKDAAELDELTSVRQELQGTARELRAATSDITAAGRDVRSGLDLATAAAPAGVGAATAGDGPPAPPAPFDPDTP